MIANLIFSVLAGLAPTLFAWFSGVPEGAKFCLYGLAIGLESGWWSCHFLAKIGDNRVAVETAKVTAETARMTEENAEKQRQWERDRQERLDAEEKARKDAVAAEEAKAIEDSRQQQAAKQAAEDAKEKAIKTIHAIFEISSNNQMLVTKCCPEHVYVHGLEESYYCKSCGFKRGEAIQLKPFGNGRWRCPTCGDTTLPPHISPLDG